MRERVQLLGGNFELLSQPGQGATIHVLLPDTLTAAQE
jgi:signal transduction histidine kinase